MILLTPTPPSPLLQKSPAEHNRLRNALQEETARVNANFKPARMFLIPVIMLINGGIFFSIFNGVRQLGMSQVGCCESQPCLHYSEG